MKKIKICFTVLLLVVLCGCSNNNDTNSKEEIEFINSVKVNMCPRCGNTSIVKNGFYKNGYQKYICKECKTSFSPLTDTIFDCKKIPISEWIEYLIHLFEFHSITTSARDNRNAVSTGR